MDDAFWGVVSSVFSLEFLVLSFRKLESYDSQLNTRSMLGSLRLTPYSSRLTLASASAVIVFKAVSSSSRFFSRDSSVASRGTQIGFPQTNSPRPSG